MPYYANWANYATSAVWLAMNDDRDYQREWRQRAAVVWQEAKTNVRSPQAVITPSQAARDNLSYELQCKIPEDRLLPVEPHDVNWGEIADSLLVGFEGYEEIL